MMTQQTRLKSYNRQIEILSRHIQRMENKAEQLASWRLYSAVASAVLLFLIFSLSNMALFWGSSLLAILLFAGLVVAHRRVESSLAKFRIWRSLKEESRARMLHDWKQIPSISTIHKAHPLEVDFDLHQLYRLLNTATSSVGSKRLQQWLVQAKPDLQIIEQRQKLLLELKNKPVFRDKLSLASRLSSKSLRGQLHLGILHDWLESASLLQPLNFWLGVLSFLQGANLILLILSQLGIIPNSIATIGWGIYAITYLSRFSLVAKLNSDAQTIYELLLRLQLIMEHLETYSYAQSPHLRKLLSPLLEAKPSQQLRRLMLSLAAGNLRPNPPIWLLLNALLPWDIFFARRLEEQKQALALSLPNWLDIWYELEALNSLAHFAYLNPESTLPELSKSSVLSVTKIQHPLLPSAKRVANDFEMQSPGELVILTGSNMSGKSSFLRTLGVNLLMAYAGGFVLAEDFHAGLFRVFSCIRVTDSLEDGISYFYAEVKRLKALLDALQAEEEMPLFFVIDEIFRGTNNRERLIGSRAYIHALVGANGLGLIATHDLELSQIADETPKIRNLHFRERIENGHMVFDYRLQEGVSPSSNALKIMAIAGLPVQDKTQTSD